MPGNSRRIPHFVIATTPRELMRRMLLVNIADNMQYQFFDIQFVNAKWVAWYLREAKINITTDVTKPEVSE